MRERLKARRAAATGTGPGTGERGEGTGGGGGSDRQVGSGPPPTITPKEPYTSHRQVAPETKTGADDVIPTVDGKGDTVAVVVADKARTTIPMKPGEAPDSLLGRADAAGDALRADRNADASVRIEHGATTTAFAKPRAGGGVTGRRSGRRDEAGEGIGRPPPR